MVVGAYACLAQTVLLLIHLQFELLLGWPALWCGFLSAVPSLLHGFKPKIYNAPKLILNISF